MMKIVKGGKVRNYSLLIGGMAVLLSCNAFAQDRQPGFYDVSAQTGIAFLHTDGSTGKYYIAETVTGGLGLFDYDNDGDLDIYFLNAAPLDGSAPSPKPVNRLYRNDGGLKFTDVTNAAGVGDGGFALGCAMADYDNDGDVDIYVSNLHEDVFLRNNGDGTFSDFTKAAGLGDPKTGAGVCFGDFNRDGWLDLFVGNYLTCPLDNPIECKRLGIPLYCDPAKHEDVYQPQVSSLYFNNGDGTFRDGTQESGIGAMPGRAMGVVCSDYDDDGDLDIYIANDVMENFLFINDGSGVFEEGALFAGVAYDFQGREQGSMGADAGDYDGDGLMDIVITNFSDQVNTLYHNDGGGVFTDVSLKSGFSQGSMPYVGWGTFFFDYDNDGDADIFVANGHLHDRIEEIEPHLKYHQPNQLYRNDGGGVFTETGAQAGPAFGVRNTRRGAAYGDLDNDGDLDIVLSNSRGKAEVWENVAPAANRWINIKLQGSEPNRDAIGARVTVSAGGKKQVNEVRAGGSYQSQYDLRLHFGLGKSEKIESIKIRWSDGTTSEYNDVETNRLILIRQGADTIEVQK